MTQHRVNSRLHAGRPHAKCHGGLSAERLVSCLSAGREPNDQRETCCSECLPRQRHKAPEFPRLCPTLTRLILVSDVVNSTSSRFPAWALQNNISFNGKNASINLTTPHKKQPDNNIELMFQFLFSCFEIEKYCLINITWTTYGPYLLIM